MVDFKMVPRYRAIFEDDSRQKLDLEPEKCYYFYEQELTYIAQSVNTLEQKTGKKVKEVEKYL